jgi:hypothetical protein
MPAISEQLPEREDSVTWLLEAGLKRLSVVIADGKLRGPAAAQRDKGFPSGRLCISRGAGQEVRTGPFVSALAFAGPSPGCEADVTPPASAWAAASLPAAAASVSASGTGRSCLLRLRTTAATALAAPVTATVEMPASLRQPRRGFAGSSRRAAEDSQAETLGATLCCRTCPVRCGKSGSQPMIRRSSPKLTTALTVTVTGLAPGEGLRQPGMVATAGRADTDRRLLFP